MTDVANTGSVQNLFKRIYVDGVKNQLPEFAQLQADWQFDSGNKTGDRYERAVMLRYPNGATYASSNRRTIYDYNSPRAGATQPAYVQSCEYTLREQIAYGLVSDAAGSEQAFRAAMDVIVMGMDQASRFHLETNLLYGSTSLGAVASVGGSGTSGTAVITAASWAAALWAATEGAELDAYDATLTTKRNTNGPIQLTNVDPDTRTLSLTYAAGADRTAVVATDVFVPVGANGNWMQGLDSLITTSVAGTTTLGISPGTYGMWRANARTLSSTALTFAIMAQFASKIAARGGIGDLTYRVSSWTWTDMMNDQAALRRFAKDEGGAFENGADRLIYHGPNGGALIVKQHPLVKAGEAFVCNDEDFRRIGSSEPTFQLPGRGDAQNPMFLHELAGKSGFEVRRWWDQALFCDRLARVGKISGIVNASLA